MLTSLQYWLLMRIAPRANAKITGIEYKNKSKLEVLLGKKFIEQLKDKVVIDFGCGAGNEAIDLVRQGVSRVIGIDIQESFINKARARAVELGVEDKCQFAQSTDVKVDAIISVDSFEHFNDPELILDMMYKSLKPDGFVMVSFGPTWYHPYGGHLFSVFPWAHLIFSEKALIQWRSNFRNDGAARFTEVAGGLNQMTIARFERLINKSDFRIEYFEPVPIKKLRPLHNRLTREFTTSIVRCKLVPKNCETN
jgi:SAM-dependent methyltransferase